MAKSITKIKKYEKTREEQVESDTAEVREAVADNKEAILKGINLLQALNEGGTLDTASAFTKTKKEALENVVQEISKDRYTPLLENLPELIFLLGEIDVKALRDLSNRLNQGLEAMNADGPEQKTSIFDLAKALKDPEINRSITMLLQFLRGMGQK
ncbi:DUF1641 domain-containing protein [Halobacillus mangrovi]|uniref:DUF1641 domain-containing protein n=1 Tax=Halobacillus mangrovi TaxID=402384 RepID=A0A1W5ZWR3_9BACI|nr:DUF1641 domain-containing protein [Halobacillus mangrovi]ARI77709.1 hypothetical protein HM131_13010 [Halobacillus mangrovi]